MLAVGSFSYDMYRQAESVHRCRCCQQGGTFPDFQSSSNLFGNDDSPQVIHSSDNAGCFHISFSFSEAPQRLPLSGELSRDQRD